MTQRPHQHVAIEPKSFRARLLAERNHLLAKRDAVANEIIGLDMALRIVDEVGDEEDTETDPQSIEQASPRTGKGVAPGIA